MTHFLCLRSSKRWQTCKGWVYVQENDEMVRYPKRYQTRLLNADLMIEEPGLFQKLETVPHPWCECDECREMRGAK